MAHVGGAAEARATREHTVSDRYQGYSQGYEGTMAHQATLRAAAVQDRLARRALAGGSTRWHARLVARLHASHPRRWAPWRRPCPPAAS